MRLFSLCLVLACGCSGKQGPTIQVRIAHGATGDGRCGVVGANDPEVTSLTNVSRVRLTWRGHGDNDPKGSFLCDRTFKANEAPNLRLHTSSLKSFDLYAEAFADADPNDPDNATHGTFRRIATGTLLNVPFNAKTLPTVRMYQVQKFGCVAARMTRPRAFHTATALPNGQVLIVGGAVAGPDANTEALGNNLFYLTGDAEIYDPEDGSFKAVAEDVPPDSRAFHQAFYVGTDASGFYQVLLVGGLTSLDGTKPAIGVTNSGLGGPRLVPFDTSQTIPAALPALGSKAQLLVYDPATLHAVRSNVDGFSEAAFLGGARFGTLEAPDGFVVAGGVNYVDPLETTQPTALSVKVERGAELMPRSADLPAGRLGPSVTILDADRALVWGGVLTGTAAQATVLTGLNSGAVPSPASFGLGVPGTQFQTATLVQSGADSQVLVTGGFLVDDTGNASQPPSAAEAVRTVTLAADGSVSAMSVPFGGGYVPDSSTCTNRARYRPAGWESAVSLPLGRGVLITGGSPTYKQMPDCNDCEAGTGLLCSIKQASTYAAAGGTIDPGPDTLQVARFGHASTLLSDGTVLITGGTTLPPDGTGPRVSADGEVYNPRTVLPPYNLTDAAPIDLDDPLAGDLVSGLLRAPGGLAYMTDPMHPVAACGDLN